jgi:membrane protease YdiL (CAAX protease family)
MDFDKKRFSKNIVWTGVVVLLCLGAWFSILPWYLQDVHQHGNPTSIAQTEAQINALPWYQRVFGVPIKEEVLLRGPIFFLTALFWKYRKIDQWLYRIILLGAVVFTSVCFYGIHIFNGGVYVLHSMAAMLIIQGFLFGMLTVKTRNIVYPIAAHSLWNALAMVF